VKNLTGLQPHNIKKGLIGSVRKISNVEKGQLRFTEAEQLTAAIFDAFRTSLDNINERGLYNLLELIESINEHELSMYFGELVEGLVYQVAKSEGRFGGEYIQPLELTRFVCGIVSELPKGACAYNPFAGAASFGVYLKKGVHYFGQEISRFSWAVGMLRLIANKKEGASDFVIGNSIKDWNPYYDKYDLIVANPPFSAQIGAPSIGRVGAVIRNTERYLIEKGLGDLKVNGKLIAVITDRFLYSSYDQSLRRELVDSDLIEMVVSFSEGVLTNTGAPVSVLVLNKDKKEKGVVRFIDGNKFVSNTNHREKILDDSALLSAIWSIEADVVRIVSNSEIEESEYNLTVLRYFQKKVEGVPLRELLSVIRGRRGVEGLEGTLIRNRDLKDDKLDYRLDLSNVEPTVLPRPSQQIDESCILIATRWKTLKPTYFEYSGTPIFVSSDIIALKVDIFLVDIGYLINELHADYVKDQVDLYRVGAVMPAIRRDDLLNIKIHLPSVDEQKAKVRGALEALAEEKKKELMLFNKIHGLEAEILEQNAYLRHSLAGPASNLRGSLANINRILVDQVVPQMPGIMELRVSGNHELTFGEYLAIISRDIQTISNAVRRQLKVEIDIESKELSPIEIIGFIQKYKSEFDDKNKSNNSLNFDVDEEVFLDKNGVVRQTYVAGNIDLLSGLLDNLVSNAVVHGFGSEGEQSIEIYLKKSSENEAQIIFSNTGKPFPEDFTLKDFIRKGAKAGSNAGDGFGGWYINEIIKKMNGSLTMNNTASSGEMLKLNLATSFEINLPIIEADEEV
jgi:type I restriction enzyme M protein